MIIDAHIHLPAISEQRTYQQSKELLLADQQRDQVDYAILMPDNVPDSCIGDFATCYQLFAEEPKVLLMPMVNIDRTDEDGLAYLESLILHKNIVGMKIIPGHDPFYPTDERLFPVYALCRQYHLPMMIHTGWNSGHPEVARFNDPKYIVEVAQRYPALSIVIAHYFWPEVDYCFELTHGYANIFYDTSGLADDEVVEATGEEAIRRVLLDTLAEDPRKIIFGTDYAECNRRQHIDLINALPIAPDVREAIFWQNAVSVFNLPIGMN